MTPYHIVCNLLANFRNACLVSFLIFSVLSSLPVAAQTESYPARPITILVGYPPGGSTDLAGRTVAEEMTKSLGVSVLVQNLSGATGAIAAQKVISSNPDGYTLLVGSNSDIAINRVMSASAKYQVTDFTPLGLIASQPLVLVASNASGVKDLNQFLNLLKQNPTKFSYGTSGTLLQMAGEMVKSQAGVSMTHVGYRGAAPLVADLLGNHIDFGVLVLSGVLPHIRSGNLIALGITEEKRSSLAPEIPSLAEHSSLTGLRINAWFALMAPPNLPTPLATKLKDALAVSLRTAEERKALKDFVVMSRTDDLPRFLAEEVAKYERIAKFAKMKQE